MRSNRNLAVYRTHRQNYFTTKNRVDILYHQKSNIKGVIRKDAQQKLSAHRIRGTNNNDFLSEFGTGKNDEIFWPVSADGNSKN